MLPHQMLFACLVIISIFKHDNVLAAYSNNGGPGPQLNDDGDVSVPNPGVASPDIIVESSTAATTVELADQELKAHDFCRHDIGSPLHLP